MLNAPNDADSVYESRLHGLVIDTKDPGQANFVMGVRALGNASGTPLDGLQDMSFGESTVNGEFTMDGMKAEHCLCRGMMSHRDMIRVIQM